MPIPRVSSLLSAVLTATLALAARPAAAQGVPTTVNFTGRLTDTAGTPIDGTRSLTLILFDQPTGGAEVWREAHPGTTFTRGLVYLTLGATTPLDGAVFDGDDRYLEIVVDGTAMAPRLPVGSVPYAVRADSAATADTAATLGSLTPGSVVTAITAGAGLAGGGTGNTVGVSLQPCAVDHYLVSSGAGWGCAPIPPPGLGGVLAGPGLTGGGTTGTPTLAANFTTAGGEAGTATTVARGDHLHDTRYPTRGDLSAAGAINTAANPVDWSKLKGVPGSLADGVDQDTTYTAGAGLSLLGTVFSVGFTAAGGDNGAATTAARGDHLHDGRYPQSAGRAGGQIVVGGTGNGENLVLRSTAAATKGSVFLADDGGRVSIGGGAPSSTLDVNGELRTNGVYQNGTAAAAAFEHTLTTYVVDAPPSQVGRVVPVDTAIFDALCRDLDGCDVTLAMVNWDPAQPGNAAHGAGRMFLSSSSRWWRMSEHLGAAAGLDGNNQVQEYRAFDCFLTDAETLTVPFVPNGRVDQGPGFGVLNCQGCDNSDTTTTCRLIVRD